MMLKNIIVFMVVSFFTTQAFACVGDQATASKSYSVYVVPQLPPPVTFARWTPVLDAVGKKSGLCFDLFVTPGIPEFESKFKQGVPDFAFMNPYHQVMAYDAKGYIPLIADSRTKLQGLILVKSDSAILDIKELNGKKIGFPSPNAFAATLLIRSILTKEGIEFEPVYVKTHSNVYRAIIVGDVAAGGAVNNTLVREPPEIKDRLKVLYRTPVFMAHPLSANPRVAPEIREKVIEAFIELGRTESGQKILDEIQIPEPTRVDYKTDYLPLEKLGVGKFVVHGSD